MGSPGKIHNRTPDCHPVYWAWIRPQVSDLTTESSFDSQASWVIDVLCLYSNMLSLGVCTTRHWQTSGRLVQELNVCTVEPREARGPKYKALRSACDVLVVRKSFVLPLYS